MNNQFKYRIENDSLIIEKCPNNELTRSLILSVPSNYYSHVYLCEGIEKIGLCAFANSKIIGINLPQSLKELDEGAFFDCPHLTKITIPNGVTEIKDETFNNCVNLEKVDLPSNLNKIGELAFNFCHNLKEINFPQSVVSIEKSAFHRCDSLESVVMPNDLKVIEKGLFSECANLKYVELPLNLEIIKQNAFEECKNLQNVTFPNTLKKIGKEAFKCCENLNSISIPEGLETIESSTFSNCDGLKSVVLPSTLKKIEELAFGYCKSLSKIEIPDSVTTIDNCAFDSCFKITDIVLSKNLKTIGDYAFYACNSLVSIVIPDSVEKLGTGVFTSCYSLKNVTLSNNIKNIPVFCFHSCQKLEEIVIPKSVNEIQMKAFLDCASLKKVFLYSSIKSISLSSFSDVNSLSKLSIHYNDKIIEVDMNEFVFLDDDKGRLLLGSYSTGNDYVFCNEGECIQFNLQKLCENNKYLNALINNTKLDTKYYINLYYWLNKKFIPQPVVFNNMPTKDIDNFFINNNCLEWNKLIKERKIISDDCKASFFKLCYVLGVFDESTKIRDRAVKFIKENIITNMDERDIHSKFDGFDLDNGYNNDFAEFYMKYYEKDNFLITEDECGDEIDLTAACYNNFNNVKKFYPNKTIHTNREADLLLPIHVMNAVRMVEYVNVDEGNEEFSKFVGRYGYSQEKFEKLQKWYNEGKNIKQMKLFINNDIEERGIKYELLRKDNSLCAVLGNITNCCQVVGGQGESCVKYGMTKPNSGFITFNYNERIIGQAWVWYDEESKTICLDNIEVPRKHLDKIEHNKEIQDNFIACLLRIEENFKKEMNDKGFEVNRVTIGQGYNDIKKILDNNFELICNNRKLKGYSGYSDAYNQYVIGKLNKVIKK